jgi:hypothetical protein
MSPIADALRLDRHEQRVCRGHSIDRQQARVRRAVEQDDVPAYVELDERALERGLYSDATA